MPLLTAAVVLASLALAGVLWVRNLALRREAFIRNASLPNGLFHKLQARHPHLSLKDCQLVAHGLRQFFLAHLKSGRRFVAMPSQVVDDLWHEFILHTRSYDAFCRHAFGGFLHHTPAVTLAGVPSQQNEGLRRCWRLMKPSCCTAWPCAAAGATPAPRRTSTRASRPGCRCSSRWTRSSASRAGSGTWPTAGA